MSWLDDAADTVTSLGNATIGKDATNAVGSFFNSAADGVMSVADTVTGGGASAIADGIGGAIGLGGPPTADYETAMKYANETRRNADLEANLERRMAATGQQSKDFYNMLWGPMRQPLPPGRTAGPTGPARWGARKAPSYPTIPLND